MRLLRRFWAKENGLPTNASLADILLAQIESHRTEVFYNLDPITFSNSFVQRLPGCVKKTIAWRAAPSAHLAFNEYDLVVSNFPGILDSLSKHGCKTAYFFPAHDPVMDEYSNNKNREIDVLFAGSYSRNHRRRAVLLEAVAELAGEVNVQYCIEESRAVKLAGTPLGLFGPLAKHRLPRSVSKIKCSSVFGRDLYSKIANAKIVLNAAVDMAGIERGNMRCWEAMGCGALLLSDEGKYPHGMVDRENFITYSNAEDATNKIRQLLCDSQSAEVAQQGREMISRMYSKEVQWDAFLKLL